MMPHRISVRISVLKGKIDEDVDGQRVLDLKPQFQALDVILISGEKTFNANE